MRSTSLLYNSLATSPFIHHLWGETVLRGTIFIIQTSDRLQYFTILQYKLHSFNIQDDRSMSRLLAKSIKKFPVTYTASRFSLLQCEMWSSVSMNINRVTLQHNKEVIMFIFYLMVFSMCNASVNSSCAQPPSTGYCGAFACLVSPGDGALAQFVLPGAGRFPTPGPFPSFWRARGFLSEYDYTEDFTGKECKLAHLSRTGKKSKTVVKACFWFYAFIHCLSSQNYLAKLGAIDVNQRFWLLN